MLKRLELVGFKSFADKTQFDFSDGITGIVGPNGSGKCLLGPTPVTLADGRDVPIRELVETALCDAATTEALDDGVLTRESPHGTRVLSLNPRTLRLEARPVAAFVKREAPASLLRVRTRSGREVVATPYHPFFTLAAGDLRALRADELRPGVRVALPRRLPVHGESVELPPFQVLQRFAPADRVFICGSPELRSWAQEARSHFGAWLAWRKAAAVPETQMRGFIAGQAVNADTLVRLARAAGRVPPLGGYLKGKNTPKRLRLPQTVTPDLARFLGLLIAEGRNNRCNQVRFVNTDAAINQEYERLGRALFGLKVCRECYRPGVEDGLIYSRTLGVVLERLFGFVVGSGPAAKEAPPQVFPAGPEVRWAFLSGLFEGDAHLAVPGGGSRSCYLEYTTASRRLALQVVSLLLRLEVFAQLRSTEKYASNTAARHRRTYHSVYVYGHEQLRRLASHLTFVGAKGEALRSMRGLPAGPNPNLDLVPGVTPLVKAAARLAGVSLKQHRRQCPKLAAYVEGRCQASRPGLLEVAGQIERLGTSPELARDLLARLRTLAASDVYWDEVVEVEQIPPPEAWVYDLCVAETHNFVAGNMIVHNSNIVDAVRWVLGEQSAKSLRGGEMADVIFNGSAVRKSLGLAEVTMTFDNARRALATDADEVQITRRVYRSGEGEYLINQQPCRLKDIKDLFLGSGAGTDAYSIIEQGRVDVLLQASTKERRTIFEEAAGISRFKAKKVETLRRLERVDQNLQRLRDILDEVEKQLRSVKLQASKAQRYQEYTGRLKELRVAQGLKEYHQLSERLRAEGQVLDELRAVLAEQTAQAEEWERELEELEAALGRLDAGVHDQEAELAGARQQIAAGEATLGHEWGVAADVEANLAQTRQALADLTGRVAALAGAAARAAEELGQVEGQGAERRQAVEALEGQLRASEDRLAALHEQVQRDKDDHFECMRQVVHLQNEAINNKGRLEDLVQERNRHSRKSEAAAEHLASLDLELQELTAADEGLQVRVGGARQALAALRQERDRLRQVCDATAARAADLRAERSGLASRIEVLQGLERSHEGLGTGVREVFALLERPDPGPWRTVLGIVADFLTVRREYAPLIDLALGERAQRFLVRDTALLGEALRRLPGPFSGRVSFLPLATPAALPALARRRPGPDTAVTQQIPADAGAVVAHPGVVALAEQVVRCDHPDLADLPARLLARTLIVRDLVAARSLAGPGTGFRCVTLQGELLEADGTVTVGTHHAEAGILSRKSELRELRERAAALDVRLTELDRDLALMREQIALLDGRAENGQTEIDVLAEQVADLRSRIGQHRQRREGLHEEVQLSRMEISELEQEIAAKEHAWRQAQEQASGAEARVQALQARALAAEREAREREGLRQRQQQEVVGARVALAHVEERLTALRARHGQLEADRAQRGAELEQAEQRLGALLARLQESHGTLLQASASLASSYLRKEAAEGRLAELEGRRAVLRQQRQQRAEQAHAVRARWRTQQEQAHARELEVNELRHRLDTLCARLQEDYQFDLAEHYRQTVAEGREPGAVAPAEGEGPAVSADEEIAELRRKLARLGSVNLDAIQELADLEARAGTLQLQYDDLTAAQRALQDIIGKINIDSTRLFTETFAAIRTHFQELFRKLFGGGMADVILEDETDVLESGIEINARPPGKELRSISLLSGGEKTLTAVALLLAIFRSKPSPFCILDEVDAALDEANIGRFTAVLRDFLDRSQFILITHSKRTMACADVLYGVTMQESGISRRFSVRFEDWPDDERMPQVQGDEEVA